MAFSFTKQKQPPSNREFKNFHFQIKAEDDEKGIISAYGSVFDVTDEGNDVVRPGAFKRTIQNSKSRVQAGKSNFLAPILWQHDPNCPIGGWIDLKEDDHGLLCKGQLILTTQMGREAYELIKAGVLNEFSIGYDVANGGSSYDSKTGVRNLTELRLWEISVVTFAMCDEALLVGVKSMETKSVCGDTSLPIGPRDESWDGSKAKDQIFAYAKKDDDSIDAAKAKKCFLQVDGDTSLKGSYGYPFCYVEGGSPRISVGGVKACANALSGARNADAGSDSAGMKAKVKTMYGRINAKYPDANPLTVPWEDDGKASTTPRERKTFMEHYNEEMAEGLLDALYGIWFVAFCKAVVDAFKIGDQPASDISDALDAFKAQFMKDWVTKATECDLSEYLATDDMDSPLNTSYGGYGSYGYMSNRHERSHKTGRSISAANQGNINDHVQGVKAMAKKAKADMQSHVDDMHDAIDGMAGAGKAFNVRDLKAGRSISATNANAMHDMADKAMSIMQDHTKALVSAANDFANVMQGAEAPAYGDGEGEADDDQQEGKSRDRRGKLEVRINDKSASAVSDDALTLALAELKTLRSVR